MPSLRPVALCPPCWRKEIDNHEPLAVFFDSKHYQALVPIEEEEKK